MKRRLFVSAPLVSALAALTGCGGGGDTRSGNPPGDAGSPAPAPTSPAADPAAPSASSPPTTFPGIDVVAEVKALRIATGPYAGGYEVAPNGKLNWYFASLGLLPIVQKLSPADLDLYVRSYLDAYLRSLNANLSIDDVEFPAGRANTSLCTRVPSDSDDSYAATLLSLAARYVAVSGDRAWWDANKPTLMDLAYRNIAMSAKPNSLTSVFQAPRNSSNSIGYLMDNCEVYRGLRDFAGALRTGGDTADANYYDGMAARIGSGIAALFQSGPNAFVPEDAGQAPDPGFYAGTTCQVFPQAFAVAECAGWFEAGWQYLERCTPGWEDGRYDPFPWAILGFVAALRGRFDQAGKQVALVRQMFSASRDRVTINELGFHQRTLDVLSGATGA